MLTSRQVACNERPDPDKSVPSLGMNDDELRAGILDYLCAKRATGADGQPLAISDANLVTRFGTDIHQLNRVLLSLMNEGRVHGRPASMVVTTEVRAEWDYVRLAEDPLPPA
jgi:hypothetical protein